MTHTLPSAERWEILVSALTPSSVNPIPAETETVAQRRLGSRVLPTLIIVNERREVPAMEPHLRVAPVLRTSLAPTSSTARWSTSRFVSSLALHLQSTLPVFKSCYCYTQEMSASRISRASSVLSTHSVIR